jgi:hypothetical protein
LQQTVADGFGANEVMLDVTAPQILRALDAQIDDAAAAPTSVCVGNRYSRDPMLLDGS